MHRRRTDDEWVEALTDWVDAVGSGGRTGSQVATKLGVLRHERAYLGLDAWDWMVRTGVVRRIVTQGPMGRTAHHWVLT